MVVQPLDTRLVRDALALAQHAHAGQMRKGTEGSLYFEHPVAVAILLASAGAPTETVAAGVLHDVVEDTPVGIGIVSDRFGSAVADTVDQVTKKGRGIGASAVDEQIETLSALHVKAADLSINCSDLFGDVEAHGHQHLDQLFRDPVEKLKHYRDLALRLESRLTRLADHASRNLLVHVTRAKRRCDDMLSM